MFIKLVGVNGEEIDSLSISVKHVNLNLSDSTDPYTMVPELTVFCASTSMSAHAVKSAVLTFRDNGEVERLEQAILNLRNIQKVWASVSDPVSDPVSVPDPEPNKKQVYSEPWHRTHGHVAENDDHYDSNDPRRRGE